jgi:hypothetical protein
LLDHYLHHDFVPILSSKDNENCSETISCSVETVSWNVSVFIIKFSLEKLFCKKWENKQIK